MLFQAQKSQYANLGDLQQQVLQLEFVNRGKKNLAIKLDTKSDCRQKDHKKLVLSI